MPKRDENRPPIAKIRTGAELRRWHWLRPELQAHARACGVRHTGGKFTILDRIAHYLDTGETTWPGDLRKTTGAQTDWHSADLTPETVITDNYKNTQNVRRFFRARAGADFKFDISFMNWMRSNAGKSLGDAVAEYKRRKG
ncbi:DUF6434 domain-containing protein [Roseobacter ponti]|uniref:DUF6434 domain-containing protein n=1 Tax=Roseobacter ponti TaxID=1891787 RepID=A0A858SXY5_9RHOB|nr:DUF6434 domain-containing protein [Roseobacter ponti]QJF52917.1 hypothetical protein G3256_17925 [Roseobacter ponti]